MCTTGTGHQQTTARTASREAYLVFESRWDNPPLLTVAAG